MLDRLVEGLASLSMSMRKRPSIRYQRNSEICKRLADGEDILSLEMSLVSTYISAGLFLRGHAMLSPVLQITSTPCPILCPVPAPLPHHDQRTSSDS